VLSIALFQSLLDPRPVVAFDHSLRKPKPKQSRGRSSFVTHSFDALTLMQ
jgi:hypothetical protein